MDVRKHVGFRMMEVNKLIHKTIGKARIVSGVDPNVLKFGYLIGYLSEHGDDVICQKDIEKKFHMPKSTATEMLNGLEKDGYIARTSIENDNRRKRIVLTEQGMLFSEETKAQIDEIEDYMIRNISEDDLDTFFRVIDMLKENVISYEKQLMKED